MSTAAERIAGDLIRRHLDQMRGKFESFVVDQPEVANAINLLTIGLYEALPEASQGAALINRFPNREIINMLMLREEAAQFESPVLYRTMTTGSIANLRQRMHRPDHPWNGCTLEIEPTEGGATHRTVYLVPPASTVD